MATMTETLKAAIRKSGLSLYAIAAGSGAKRPSLSRFMAGKQSLMLNVADKVAEFLRLELKPAKRQPSRKR